MSSASKNNNNKKRCSHLPTKTTLPEQDNLDVKFDSFLSDIYGASDDLQKPTPSKRSKPLNAKSFQVHDESKKFDDNDFILQDSKLDEEFNALRREIFKEHVEDMPKNIFCAFDEMNKTDFGFLGHDDDVEDDDDLFSFNFGNDDDKRFDSAEKEDMKPNKTTSFMSTSDKKTNNNEKEEPKECTTTSLLSNAIHISTATATESTTQEEPDSSVKDQLKKLQRMMTKSTETQRALQQWDRQNGLPKNHCKTMVSSTRSRRKLQQNKSQLLNSILGDVKTLCNKDYYAKFGAKNNKKKKKTTI